MEADVRVINALIKKYEDIDYSKDMLYRHICKTGVVSDGINFRNGIKSSIPYAVCPSCQGLGLQACNTCKSSGFVTKTAWETGIPEETKTHVLLLIKAQKY